MARAVLKPKSGTDLDKLSKTLRELRETQSETRQALYDNIFYYLNVSEKKDTYIAEAFLIKTANRLFGEFTTDSDTALMALGLLEGYDYNSAKNCKQRRIKFLKESMYLAKRVRRLILKQMRNFSLIMKIRSEQQMNQTYF